MQLERVDELEHFTCIYTMNNRDLMSTAQILGHANLNTAGIYAKMDTEGLLLAIDNTEE